MARLLKNRLKTAADQLDELLSHDHPGATPQMNIGEVSLRILLINDDVDKIGRVVTEIKGISSEWTQIITKMVQKDQDTAQDDYDKYVDDLEVADKLKSAGTRVRAFKTSQISLAKAKAELEAAPPQHQPPAGVPGAQATGAQTPGRVQYQVEIAKIRPPIFMGGKTEWQSWWPVYNLAIHSDPSKPKFLKMADIMSLLKGEAKDIVFGLQLTDADYDLAIKALTEKYDDNSHMVRDLHRQLISLKPSQSFDDDRKLLIDVQRITRMLKNNAQDINAPTIWLTLEQKVTKPVLRQLQEAKAKAGVDWDTEKFLSSFKDLVIAEEAIEEIYNQSHPRREIGKRPKMVDKEPFKKFQTTIQTTVEQKGKNAPKRATTGQSKKGFKKSEVDNKSKTTPSCRLCSQSHWTSSCSRYKDTRSREEKAKELKLCLKCLGSSHSSNECTTKIRNCWYCNKWGHNRVFCPQQFGAKKQGFSVVQQATIQQSTTIAKENKSSTTQPANETDTRAQHKLLLTKKVTVYNPENPKLTKKVLVFFDSGSERSYVEKALASFLRLDAKNPAEITLTGFAGVDLGTYTMHMTKLCMKTAVGEKTFEPEITTRVLREMAHIEFANLFNSDFEATNLQSPAELIQPQVLIGTDYFADFDIKAEKQLPSGFWVANSKVGRLIFGKGILSKPRMARKVTSTAISQEAVEVQLQNEDNGLNTMVKEFFDLEAAGMADAAHPSDNEQWLDHFNKELRFNQEEGRYEVALPWNDRAEELQPNYGLARGRLDNNLKKLDEEKFKLYDQIIQEQIDAGIVEVVPNPSEWTDKLHYLPHQAVIKDDHQTTKLRIVYDGSAHTKDTPSLNQCLDKGPQLLNDLIGIIMRCRMSEILICADIEKAFLQILIREQDRDALRFLWVNNDEQVRTYRFRRVPFGLISSPAHLSVTLKHHLDQSNHPLAKDIARNLYVDNILLCTDSFKDIPKVCQEMRQIFKTASMKLREFGANHRGILELPEDWLTNPHRMKILGIKWNPFKDQMEFQLPNFQVTKVTKRAILSHLASVFDPLGLLSPVILPGKILLSKLWHKKFGWDDELNEGLASEWTSIIQDWPAVCFSIPRMASLPTPKEKTIHVFADASGKAMGVCAYLRSANEEKIKTMLLFAKSLVVPLKTPEKQNTIPRLELQALKIATNVAEKLQKELPETTKVTLWTDSRDALEWAKSGKKQDRYVENRLNKIRKFTVRFVAGVSNPADIASRGAKATELQDNRVWQHGPGWLSQKETEWPMDQIIFDPQAERPTVESEGPIMEMTLPTVQHFEIGPLIDESRFSSWIKIRRTMALVLRVFLPKNREPKKGNLKEKLEAIQPAQTEELLKAEQILIKSAQQRHPADGQVAENLQLYEDENGILRSKGRIQKGDIAESAKNPIFLPCKAEITALVIRHIHNRLHAGANTVLSEIRQDYWVPQARRTIRNVLQNRRSRHFCHTCHKFKSKPFGLAPMPPLPQFRVDGLASRPFLNIGLDYFGPMLTKSSGKEMKVWGCIFTCAVTRGIHIELVNDLTAEAFLNALSRFCARRKVPKLIVSDNAKTFQLGAKAATQIWHTPYATQLFNQPTIQKTVADIGIKWRFNIERAPWTGGFFEKMVHLVKEPLRKTLGKKLVHHEQLLTTLIEIEKIINDRPLTYISEAEKTTILRPIDFISPYLDNEVQEIWLGEEPDPRDPEFIANPTSQQSLIAKFKNARQSADRFWMIWRNDYLTALREKQKSAQKGQRVPEIGEIVIIHDDSPRNQWKLGKIVKLLPSGDGFVRSAVVWTQKTELKRPVTKLYPLELAERISEPKNLKIGSKTGKIITDNDSSNSKVSEMDDVIELDYEDLHQEETEEVARTGPRNVPTGGESHPGQSRGSPDQGQHHGPVGGESHQDRVLAQPHRSRSSKNRTPYGAERHQRASEHCGSKASNERSARRSPSKGRAHASRKPNKRVSTEQQPQLRQPRYNWAPHPPAPVQAATPPIMAAIRPKSSTTSTEEVVPVNGIFRSKKWKLTSVCNGVGAHFNCTPTKASDLSDDLAAIYIPTVLHLLLAQILQEYSSHRAEISNAIQTLTTSRLTADGLIQMAISKKPLLGYRYKTGTKWQRGIPNEKKMAHIKARGTPQSLWWKFSDATKSVQIWNERCQVARAETATASTMEAAIEVDDEQCPDNNPAKGHLAKMREDVQMALQFLAHEQKTIITSKLLLIAEETTESFGYAISAFVLERAAFLNSVLGIANEAVVLWVGSDAIQRALPWAEFIAEVQPVVEKLIKVNKRFIWICPPKTTQHAERWREYEEGFLTLARTDCGQGRILIMPFSEADVSSQGFITESAIAKTKKEMETILYGKKEEARNSLEHRLENLIKRRTSQAQAVNTNVIDADKDQPMMVVAASTSVARSSSPHLEQVEPMPSEPPQVEEEETPWTWASMQYFVDSVNISETKMKALDEALESFIFCQVPPPEEREQKEKALETIKRTLRWKTWQNFEVVLTGSTSANTATKNSDMDVVLRSKDGTELREEQKIREMEFLIREFYLAKRHFPFRHCVLIKKTKAPLIKMKTNEGLDVDITVDNTDAITNSQWLAEQAADIRFWRLYMTVKLWAKFNGVGDAATGGLNSLCWAIMTKHFMASRSGLFEPSLVLEFLRMTEYFAGYPFEGYTITKEGWRKRDTPSTPICVEDPFNVFDNCARNRKPQDVSRIRQRMENAWSRFVRKKEEFRLADFSFPDKKDPPAENFPRQIHDRSTSPDGAMIFLSLSRDIEKSESIVDSKESEVRKSRGKQKGLKKSGFLSKRRTHSDSKESTVNKKGSLIKRLLTIALISALVRPTQQQSAMICNQATHPHLAELTSHFQCNQLMATNRNATLDVYRPVQRVSQIKAAYCNIVHQRVIYWKNLILEWRNTTTSRALPTSKEECKRMWQLKQCQYGELKSIGGSSRTFQPFQPTVDYSYFATKEAERTNCFLTESVVYYDTKEKRIHSPLGDMTSCKLGDEWCVLRDGAVIVWSTPADAECQFERIDIWEGQFHPSESVWTHKELALSFPAKAQKIKDCGRTLVATDQGFAVEAIMYLDMIAQKGQLGKGEQRPPPGGAQKRSLLPEDQFTVDTSMRLEMMNQNVNQTKPAPSKPTIPKTDASKPPISNQGVGPQMSEPVDRKVQSEPVDRKVQSEPVDRKVQSGPVNQKAQMELLNRKVQPEPFKKQTVETTTAKGPQLDAKAKPATIEVRHQSPKPIEVPKTARPKPVEAPKTTPPKQIVAEQVTPRHNGVPNTQPTLPPTENQPKSRDRGRFKTRYIVRKHQSEPQKVRIYENPRARRATVHTEQLASQLTASQVNTMGKLKLLVCWLMKHGPSSSLDTGNPTMVARTVLRQQFVQAKWVSLGMRQVMKIWQCLPIKRQTYQFAATKSDFCSKEIPINLSLPDRQTMAYLDPVTLVISDTTSNGSCADYQTQTMLLEGQILTVDQITGDTIITDEKEVTKIEYGTANQNHVPALEPLIFHNLALFNDSDPTIQALAMFKAYRLGKQLQQEAHQARAHAGAWSPLPSLPSFSLGNLLQGFISWDLVYKATALYVLGKIVQILLRKYLQNILRKWMLIPGLSLPTQTVRRNPVTVRYEKARHPKSRLEESLEEVTRQLEEGEIVTIEPSGGAC